jgi:hypothetical protein
MDMLKEQRNRGYVIAGAGGIIAFIAFFLPYVTVPVAVVVSGYGYSWSGSSIGGWLYLELLASLVAVAIPLALIYRHNAFGLTNMPVEKQIRYGIFTLIGAGAVGLLIQLILAANHNNINGQDLTSLNAALGFGWWLYLLSALAIAVGGVMTYRSIGSASQQAWQYPSTQYSPYNQPYPPQQTQYPPYPTTDQPQSQYLPYQTQYPPVDPQQYQATELKPYPQTGPQAYPPTQPGQQYAPTELRPNPQTGPQGYPPTQPGQQYVPTELQQPPSFPQQQQYPPQQYPPSR